MYILQQIASNSSASPTCRTVLYDGENRRIEIAELYPRARALATLLQQYGVEQGSEQSVLLCLPRSPSLVIAHLAVFLAGGVIVPVDPQAPAARLYDIVADAKPCCAIVSSAEQAKLLGHYCRTVQMDELLNFGTAPSHVSAPQSEEGLPWHRVGHEAAYIIYTSGTTGKPKGVVVELHSLEALLQWHLNAFELTNQSCVSLTASPSFDASIWEIWSALAAGASIHVCTDDERLDPMRLQKLWVKNGVTHVFVSTPLVEQLLDLDWSSPDVRLRFVLTGGDRLTRRPAPDIPFRLMNNYGPSEGCVVATSGPVAALTPQNATLPPDIGYPLPHMNTYILDEKFRPVPRGEKGKLWIGGVALARGYLNNEVLTLESFQCNPFSDECDARMYNTGDIVSENEDGSLCYHGRDDAQVKIDGVRIELAEVECVVCLHPEVAQAVAMVITLPTTHVHRLVCSIVPRKGQLPTSEDLRVYVEARLPSAMIPMEFLIHPTIIPLTANGKVDRSSLEKVHQEAILAKRSQVLTDDVVTGELGDIVQIWSAVLGFPVGPTSDFFALGGYSLAAARIAARTAVHFEKECKPSHILTCRTPIALSTLLPSLPLVDTVHTDAPEFAPNWWFPVTPMQQGLWYLWSTNEQNPFYNIGATFVVDGHLDEATLRAATVHTLSKYHALQTCFRQNPESLEIEQKVEPLSEGDLLSHIAIRPVVANLAEALVQAEITYKLPFQLEKAPLFRCLYVPISTGQSVFLFVCHHIVADGLSLNVLFSMLSQNYAAFLADRDALIAPQLSETPFARFISWQEQHTQRPETHQFWAEKAEEIKLCEFPLDGEYDESVPFQGSILECRSHSDLGELLGTFCKEQKVSRFVAMLAAWYATLARFCHQDELTVGIPFHGRTHPAFENTIGMFVNLVPLPISLTRGQCYRDFVKTLALELDAALEHGDLSITQIATLMRRRSDGAIGMVNTTFSEKVVLNFSLPGMNTTLVEIDTGGARFGLSAFLHTQGDRIVGHIEYTTPLFTKETVAGIMDTYFAFLEQALRSPLTPWEFCFPEGPCQIAEQVAVSEACSQSLPLHTLFEQAALQYANVPALRADGMQWTYRELDTQANKLAAALRNVGVQQGDLVPLMMDRSPQLIFAILAVLKLGAIYVPLDPENPRERSVQLLQSLEARIIINGTCEPVPPGPWKLCSVEDLLKSDVNDAVQLPYPQVKTLDAAYLMFTSGSTGIPKGVLCPHLGAALRVQWQLEQEHHVLPGERVLFKTPYTFDVSVWEIFYPLSSGATLVIAPAGLQRDPLGIATLIAAEQIQLCHFVPTMLHMFLDAIETEQNLDLSHLRIVHASGEALATRLLQRLHSLLPHVRVFNLYGPTEAGIEVTCYDSRCQETTHVNLGRPLPYVSTRIVDDNNRPVPKGCAGELLIGGPSLALEYFHNPDETSRMFVSLPGNENTKNERFYKTGDLVRQRNDGTLDFLGRIDAQIKLNGVRIELEEIEACIAEIEGIQEAMVVATTGHVTLVCFYVAKKPLVGTNTAMATTFKGILAKQLPTALIPTLFMPLTSLPLTRSGKRDRKNLLEKANALLLAHKQTPGKVPQTRLELRIMNIWCQVLKLTEVGSDQNFFELGGDSVKTLQIVSLLSKEGIKLSPRDFFHHPTIEELAHYVEETGEVLTVEEVKAHSPKECLLPLTPLQSVMLLETLKDPCIDAYWQVIAYSLPATISSATIKGAWLATVKASPALRTRIVWNTGQPGQVIEENAKIDFEVCDWHIVAKAGQTLEEWSKFQVENLKADAMQRLQKVFCLENWCATPNGIKKTIFVWVHHHILLDGWSMAQCLNDFFRCLHNNEFAIPQRPSLAAYFSWRQNSDNEERAKDFWKHELGGVQAAEILHIEKPIDVHGERSSTATLKTQDRMFSSRSARQLAAFCHHYHLTSASVVTCLWGLIVRQYQDTDDICVGMTFANRPYQLSCAQELSGMLINTLPVRMKFRPDIHFVAGCRSVLASLMSIAQHAGSSYAALLESAGLPGMTELFKSTLVFQNFEGDLHPTVLSNDPIAWQPGLLLARGISTDPLSLTLDICDESIAVRIEWDENLYHEEKVASLVTALNYWLERVNELAAVPLEHLSLLTPEEKATLNSMLCSQSSSTEEMAPWCLGTYLQSAEGTATAVYDGQKLLSYAELRQRATRLASHLASVHHIQSGDTVAYIGKRSVEAVIAISAAWLLGAAWCALDPDFPKERQHRILQTLKPKAVISLTSVYALTDTCLSQDDDSLLTTIMVPEQVAYYISTSGSSGQPKLVALQAGGISQISAAWKQYYMTATGVQSVLQIGTWTSDVFLGDFLKAVTTAGTLVICPDDKRIDMQYLEQLLHEWKITLVESTPTLMSSLMRHVALSLTKPKALQTVIVGADTFRIEELHALCGTLWDGVKLYNGYGLSECTIESIVFPCSGLDPVVSRSGLCPLGHPLPGTHLRIVDDRGYDRVPGAIGELYIGGVQVAQGYMTGDGLLVDDRFLMREGRRYFKTGDLARLSEHGVIEFFGRRDTQVKIRGHRVELGEIENALLGQTGVQEVAVFTAELAGNREIVAFVSGDRDVPEIQDALRSLLAEYAMPRHFVLLATLPRTANGKVDRVLLNEKATSAMNSLEGEFAPPSSGLTMEIDSLEQTLVSLWQKLLNRSIRTNRSFFDQGGHSLLVLQLYESMKEKLPTDSFEIADLFHYPTIHTLKVELLARRAAHMKQSHEVIRQEVPQQDVGQGNLLTLLRQIQHGDVSPDEALKLLEGQQIAKRRVS